MPIPDFKDQLTSQLQFLRNSCEHFDKGMAEEAVRIATTLRVIFHQTKASTSLLTHMQGTKTPIASTIRAKSGEDLASMGNMTHVRVETNPIGDGTFDSKATILPYGIAGLEGRSLPADEWWEEPVYVRLDGKFHTRAQIIKYAANKDGGAHVAEKLPEDLYELSNASMSYTVTPTPGHVEGDFMLTLSFTFLGQLPPGGTTVPNFLYFDIRQMATEVLNSPDLLALAQ